MLLKEVSVHIYIFAHVLSTIAFPRPITEFLYMTFAPLVFFIVQIIFNITAPELSGHPISSRFENGITTGILVDKSISEASGMVASVANPGYYWVINDSGNPAILYLIDSLGNKKQDYSLKDTHNIDWEDITLAENPGKNSHQLIIADIGDNYSIRPFIQLIVLEEPKFASTTDSLLTNFQIYKYVYEDGARDAETILVDPLTNETYIISKRESQVGMYKVPAFNKLQDPDTLRFIGRLPFHNVTAGSISPAGTEILLKNYDYVFYWTRSKDQSLPATLQALSEQVPYIVEPQGESITWNLAGSGFYTLSELSYADKQQLYFYRKKP